jgi:hypothetical protein
MQAGWRWAGLKVSAVGLVLWFDHAIWQPGICVKQALDDQLLILLAHRIQQHPVLLQVVCHIHARVSLK